MRDEILSAEYLASLDCEHHLQTLAVELLHLESHSERPSNIPFQYPDIQTSLCDKETIDK